MELEAEGLAQRTALHGEIIALRQQARARGQIEALPVPLIDVVGKGAGAEPVRRLRRADGVIADLGAAFVMLIDPMAQMPRHELGAQAQAEIGHILLQGDADEVHLLPDEIALVIGAHRPAEDHHARVIAQIGGQGIAQHRAAHVEPISARCEQPPDTPWRGMLLMENHENPPLGGS